MNNWQCVNNSGVRRWWRGCRFQQVMAPKVAGAWHLHTLTREQPLDFFVGFSSVASLALAQFMWIRGSAGLGIMLASLHMNAVPFYVMVIVVLFLGESWNWWQAVGAAVVAVGVLLAQSASSQQ